MIVRINYFIVVSIRNNMAYVHTTAARNRINPLSISAIEQPAAGAGPYVTYDEVALCADPNCPVCRAQRRDKRQKKRRHHRHHRKHRTHFWDDILRTESAGSVVSVHSIELGDRRTYHNTNVVERDVVPVNQVDRQVVSRTTTTRPNRYADEDIAREAWVKDFFSLSLNYLSIYLGKKSYC